MNQAKHLLGVSFLVLFFIVAQEANSEDRLSGRNCVDIAIARFAESLGKPIDQSVYDSVLRELSLSPRSTTRTVAETMRVLQEFGIQCVAYSAPCSTSESIPDRGIVFCDLPKVGGHCFFVRRSAEGVVVHDKEVHLLTLDDWRRLGEVIVVIPRGAYQWSRAKYFSLWLTQGFVVTLVCGLAFNIGLSLWKQRTAFLLSVLALCCFTGGCGVLSLFKKNEKRQIIDLGVVSEDVVEQECTVRVRYEAILDRIVKGCSCLSVGSIEGTRVTPDKPLSFLCRLDVSDKTGDFVERLDIYWKEQEQPDTILLTGFATKPPLTTPEPVVVPVLKGKPRDAVVEARLVHAFDEHPTVTGCDLVNPKASPIASLTSTNIASENRWLSPGKGAVRYTQKLTCRLKDDWVLDRAVDVPVNLRWSEAQIDNTITVRLVPVPELEFPSDDCWLCFKPDCPRISEIRVKVHDGSVSQDAVVIEFSDPRLKCVNMDLDRGVVHTEFHGSPDTEIICHGVLKIHGKEVDRIRLFVN